MRSGTGRRVRGRRSGLGVGKKVAGYLHGQIDSGRPARPTCARWTSTRKTRAMVMHTGE